MKIPYYKQETKYTCGPACMRMVLNSIGVKKSEKALAKKMQTNKIIGTWHKYIPQLAEAYKLDYIIEREGTISDLRRLYRAGWEIIVCYNTNRTIKVDRSGSHYAVIKKINWHSIYLLDPYYGDKKRYFVKIFKRKWRDSEEFQWFAAIKKARDRKYIHVNR
jgi:ABC-type bacteriocin/lantibiotic exporter with double-glycine peptidase domain